MASPSVAIVMINWNQEKDSTECLRSLQAIDYDNYKIILVDNNSTDNSLEILKKEFAELDFLENSENLGFTGGMNTGIKHALENKFEYILILNNDTTVKPDFLNKLVDLSQSDDKIGISGPAIYDYYNPSEIDFAGGKINLLTGNIMHIKTIINADILPDQDYVTGCCMLIRRSVLEECGMFDDDYFIYMDDVDLSLRIRNKGYSLKCNPQSIIWHKVTASLNKEVAYYFWFRNVFKIINKYSNPYLKFIPKLKILCVNLVYCILTSVLKGSKKEVRGILTGVFDALKKNYGKGSLNKVK